MRKIKNVKEKRCLKLRPKQRVDLVGIMPLESVFFSKGEVPIQFMSLFGLILIKGEFHFP